MSELRDQRQLPAVTLQSPGVTAAASAAAKYDQ